MKNKKVLIIGAGLAGLSIAYFLRKRGIGSIIFEKDNNLGGLCRSIKKDGFTFDVSGHLMHFRNPKTQSLVKELLGDNLANHQRDAWVYAFNKLIPYPFQASLKFLPKAVIQECLDGFIEAQKNGKTPLNGRSFLDWSNRKFGEGINRHFIIPYNRKFWKTSLEELTYDWAERFVVVPSLTDIIRSSEENSDHHLGYSANFWYPKKGGISELVKAFVHKENEIRLEHELSEINLAKKTILFNNGKKEHFDIIFSTIALPEFKTIIKGLPSAVNDSLGKLRWISIYNVNLGIQKAIEPKRHWIYFPESDISYFRVGFFHNFSNHLSPEGKSSLYIETSYCKDNPIDKENIISYMDKDLQKIQMLPENSKICAQDINDINYGYPVYDRNYKSARKMILDFLSENNIFSCGRYGSWYYASMEDVIMESEKLVENLCRNN